jgi:RNA polymerase sigma-70 factor (ECF subfamily)
VPGSDDTKIMGDRVRFPTTSWNLVRTVRNVRSLESLITIYWKPLYFFVRQKGFDNERSKDLVQGFLTTCLEKGSLAKADPMRGRFRTFLLASIANYVKDALKAESTLKRGGHQAVVSLDFSEGEREYAVEVPKDESPESALYRAWARNLWRHALSELEGDPAHLEAFRMYVAGADYPALTKKTGLSESAARTAIHRLKGQLRDRVIEHIGSTACDAAEVEAELAEFIQLLS